MPTEAGPLALPYGGVSQGRAEIDFGTGYSLNLGSADRVYDDVHPWDYAQWRQTVDLTSVDVITFKLGLQGAAPVDRPSNLVALAHCDGFGTTEWDLDYAREGGTLTGTTVGSPTRAAGKFNEAFILNAVEAVTWSGADIIDAAIDTGTIAFWWRPDYTGAPGARQYLISTSESSASQNNGVRVYHDTGPVLGWDIYDSAGLSICSATRSFSPTSGSWYHVLMEWDTTPSTGQGSVIYVNGSIQGSLAAGTGTRTDTAAYMAVGRWLTSSNSNTFGIDEIHVYDELLYQEQFDPPDGALPEPWWFFRVVAGGTTVYEDRIYQSTDVEYTTRAINVSAFTGSTDLDFRLIAA